MTAGTVGFIGLGNMGIPMTRRLVAAGYHVRGFDTSAEARENFEAIGSSDAGGGVTAITEIGSVGDGADALILMLPDSDIVERVLLGRLASEPADQDRGRRAAGQPGAGDHHHRHVILRPGADAGTGGAGRLGGDDPDRRARFRRRLRCPGRDPDDHGRRPVGSVRAVQADARRPSASGSSTQATSGRVTRSRR